jgi:hypothetical protein
MSEQTWNGSADDDRNGSWKTLVTGLSGAAALTLTHEIVRQLVPSAPRMDKLGMDALSRGLRAFGVSPPRGEQLRGITLAGDLASNALFYALARGKGRQSWLRGAGLGLAAGLGAVLLPGLLGLPRRHAARTLQTQVMTVALYAAGGLVSAAMASFLDRGASGEPRRIVSHTGV